MIVTHYTAGVQVKSAAAGRDDGLLKLAHIDGPTRALLALPIILAVCGCSGSSFTSDGWFAKPLEFTSRPSWLFYSDGRGPSRTRPVGPEDLVSADGSCAAPAATQASAPADIQSDAASQTANTAPPGPALAPTAVGLDMTECEVVRRAGHTSAIQIGNNARGERSVVMTYTSGPSPGIYRFTAGRLTSIERVAEPEPPPKSRRPARPQTSRART
jgi:hypothetical protein